MTKLEKLYNKLPDNFDVFEFVLVALTRTEWNKLEDAFEEHQTQAMNDLESELEFHGFEFPEFEQELERIESFEFEYDNCSLDYREDVDNLVIRFEHSELEEINYFNEIVYKTLEDIESYIKIIKYIKPEMEELYKYLKSL